MTFEQELEQMMHAMTEQDAAELDKMCPPSAADRAAMSRIRARVSALAAASLAAAAPNTQNSAAQAQSGAQNAAKSAVKQITRFRPSALMIAAGSAAACATVAIGAVIYHRSRVQKPEVLDPPAVTDTAVPGTEPAASDTEPVTEITDMTAPADVTEVTQQVTAPAGTTQSAAAAVTETTVTTASAKANAGTAPTKPRTTAPPWTPPRTTATALTTEFWLTSVTAVSTTGATTVTTPRTEHTACSTSEQNTDRTPPSWTDTTDTGTWTHEWWVWEGSGYWDNGEHHRHYPPAPTWETTVDMTVVETD